VIFSLVEVAMAATLTVDLPGLIAGAEIPAEYSCRGQDVSPAVVWSEPPVGTAAFAVVVDDPDAPGGTFVHWVAYNLPASARGLPKGVAPWDPAVPQGTNSFRRPGWSGPCPPQGSTHRYFVRVYALDTALTVHGTPNRGAFEAAITGHVLAAGEWMGRFSMPLSMPLGKW
jgi:Raf kinase inhibitor-like YbhB/YbcL family protein